MERLINSGGGKLEASERKFPLWKLGEYRARIGPLFLETCHENWKNFLLIKPLGTLPRQSIAAMSCVRKFTHFNQLLTQF